MNSACPERAPDVGALSSRLRPNVECAPWVIAEVKRLEAHFDFVAHLQRQRDWSGRTFGPGARAQGVVDHIRKELLEVEADPGDLKEWIDVVILALDGAWRTGAQPSEIVAALVAKQTKNEGRTWPGWRTADPNKAIEHNRTDDWPKEGDLVRYANGETALAILGLPHAGGWHGDQCCGGSTFFLRVVRPSLRDMQTWLDCAHWRRDRPTIVADERVRSLLSAAASQPVEDPQA